MNRTKTRKKSIRPIILGLLVVLAVGLCGDIPQSATTLIRSRIRECDGVWGQWSYGNQSWQLSTGLDYAEEVTAKGVTYTLSVDVGELGVIGGGTVETVPPLVGDGSDESPLSINIGEGLATVDGNLVCTVEPGGDTLWERIVNGGAQIQPKNYSDDVRVGGNMVIEGTTQVGRGSVTIDSPGGDYDVIQSSTGHIRFQDTMISTDKCLRIHGIGEWTLGYIDFYAYSDLGDYGTKRKYSWIKGKEIDGGVLSIWETGTPDEYWLKWESLEDSLEGKELFTYSITSPNNSVICTPSGGKVKVGDTIPITIAINPDYIKTIPTLQHVYNNSSPATIQLATGKPLSIKIGNDETFKIGTDYYTYMVNTRIFGSASVGSNLIINDSQVTTIPLLVKSSSYTNAFVIENEKGIFGVPSVYVGDVDTPGSLYISDGSNNYARIYTPGLTEDLSWGLPAYYGIPGTFLADWDGDGRLEWQQPPIVPSMMQFNLAATFPGATGAVTFSPTDHGANVVRIFPFEIDRSITVNQLSIRCAGAVADCLIMGIFDSEGTRIWTSGVQSTPGGNQYLVVTANFPVTLQPGTYYFGTTNNGVVSSTLAYAGSPQLVNAALPRWGTVPTTFGQMPTSIDPTNITETVGGWMIFVLLSNTTT